MKYTIVHADASCYPNPGQEAAYIGYIPSIDPSAGPHTVKGILLPEDLPDQPTEVTNISSEAYAVLKALELAKANGLSAVHLKTDSLYCLRLLRREATAHSHPLLWEQIYALADTFDLVYSEPAKTDLDHQYANKEAKELRKLYQDCKDTEHEVVERDSPDMSASFSTLRAV
jgi:ribonuclease HI